MKNIISLGRHPVNSLKPGQTVRFASRIYSQEAILTIRKMHWMKDKVILSGDEVNGVALAVHDWVELVKVEEEEDEGEEEQC